MKNILICVFASILTGLLLSNTVNGHNEDVILGKGAKELTCAPPNYTFVLESYTTEIKAVWPFDDNIICRYRKSGTATWSYLGPYYGQFLICDSLEEGAEYEFQFAKVCGSEQSSYTSSYFESTIP
ncbi:hypothetical protein MQE36_09345 [Zhouia spongiae]|uniref:Fibronectin type-III domain-containing protein n=1 Tax=Zhouia spongiae TaxID=2202721 RepID=A0ABY3YH94_9FLAO|nr:hypothetical protein [Zhouia spongiae]UNY97302.1 hypothetical protein MQE36_09345 [Zhouia spongiae]